MYDFEALMAMAVRPWEDLPLVGRDFNIDQGLRQSLPPLKHVLLDQLVKLLSI